MRNNLYNIFYLIISKENIMLEFHLKRNVFQIIYIVLIAN